MTTATDTTRPAGAEARTGGTRLTGIKPTGHLHLGNYVGAIRPIVTAQDDSVAVVADLHALTVPHDAARLPALTREVAAILLAAGVDPSRATLYVQSHLPEHTELHYLLESTTGYGEARRMIQFREKAGGHTRLSLLTYPVLMAGDILLHGAQEVPVGDDQSQHVELARTVAARFNARYGHTFVLPRPVKPGIAARIMDLTDPTAKMGKTGASTAGTLFLLDPPDVVRRKVMRAVTDPGAEVRHDPAAKPGVSNLLEILAACTGASLDISFSGYGALKAAATEAVVETVRPIQAAYAGLDPAYVDTVLRAGAGRARKGAAATVSRAKRAIGLLP